MVYMYFNELLCRHCIAPTNRTRSGSLTEINLDRALMSGSLSCILPAVSTSTTSMRELRA